MSIPEPEFVIVMTTRRVQASLMASRLTPEVLLRRAVVAYEARNEDDLAGKTPRSLRTLKRWKAEGFPPRVRETLDLLDEIGLLVRPEEAAAEDDTPDRLLERAGIALATLIQGQREMLEQFDDVATRLSRAIEALPRDQAGPKRKGRRA